MVKKFERLPHPYSPTFEGIIATGGELTPELLQEAYGKGIFPWPQSGSPMLWFSPEKRGILEFKDFHVPASMLKFAKKHSNWRYTLNEDFPNVIRHCRTQERKDQNGTWILPEVVDAYLKLAEKGHILSLEVWEEQELIGGIYGVYMDGFFSGESMFHLRTNASKMALWKMVEHLKSQGLTWIDTQMVTPVVAAFGGKLVPREVFLKMRGL